jgi:sulfoxide reductase catalytic subunit YedY
MLIARRQPWHLPDSVATPEAVFLNRRALLAGSMAAAAIPLLPAATQAQEVSPIADLFPAKNNAAFVLDRPLTPEEVNGAYNNFYEFGSHKGIARAAQALKVRPWTVAIDGLVEKPMTVDIDTLIRGMPVEERLYRHRCVEAWSMTVPWTGFALKALVDYAKPLGDAKYVRFETFMNPDVASGQSQTWYPWPYVEGLTIAEATNDLAFMVIGAYGKPLANQFGAPLRLATPWKYGFKSIKSIVKVSFVAERPKSFWEAIQAEEYGFWANVNPEVPHPRWSQATERVLGTDETRPTLLFNGYGDLVADLYKGLEAERLWA